MFVVDLRKACLTAPPIIEFKKAIQTTGFLIEEPQTLILQHRNEHLHLLTAWTFQYTQPGNMPFLVARAPRAVCHFCTTGHLLCFALRIAAGCRTCFYAQLPPPKPRTLLRYATSPRAALASAPQHFTSRILARGLYFHSFLAKE